MDKSARTYVVSIHTHTHAHHLCKNTQEVLVVIVIWLLSYVPTSEPIIEWGEHSGNSNGKRSSFSLQTTSSEILWRLPQAPSWYRDVYTHIAFIGFDWQVCLVSCTQFQVSVRLDSPHLGASLLLKSLLALAQATWICYGLRQGLDRCRWWGHLFFPVPESESLRARREVGMRGKWILWQWHYGWPLSLS